MRTTAIAVLLFLVTAPLLATTVGADAGPFDVAIEDTNAPVAAGDDIETTVVVRNRGDASHEDVVTVSAPDLPTQESTVTVGAGESVTQSVRIPTSSSDVGSHALRGRFATAASEETAVTVEENTEEPELRVRIERVDDPIALGVDDLTGTITVENVGEARASDELWLGLASTPVRLEPGERQSYTLTHDIRWEEPEVDAEPGSHEIRATLTDGDAEDAATFQVVVPEPEGSLRPTVRAAASPVEAGDPVRLEVAVKNVGDGRTEGTVVATHPDLGRSTADVALGPDAVTEETLTIPTAQTDTGRYDVDIRAGERVVRETVEVVDPSADEPRFRVAIRDVDDEVRAGDDVAVTTEIENAGDGPDETTLVVGVPGVGRETSDVTLDAGEGTQRTVELPTAAGDAGDHQVVARAGGHRDAAAVDIVERSEPSFRVAFVDSDTSVERGEEVELQLRVANVGDVSGRTNVTVFVPEGDRRAESVSVGAGEDATVDVALASEGLSPGPHEVEAVVGGASATMEVTVEEVNGPTLPDIGGDGPFFGLGDLVDRLRFWA